MASCWFCAPGVALPADNGQDQQRASRAMLDFLTLFAELDDAEFDLIAAYADQDEKIENPADEQTSNNLEQQDQTHD